MADEQHHGEAQRPTPEMHLQFVCAAYSIRISTWASAEAVDFAIAALQTFKRNYFGEEPDGGGMPPTAAPPDGTDRSK